MTYCERGEQNEEVVVTGAAYFHTLMPVLETMAEKYHVYGVVMRMSGDATEFNADGTPHWGRQWGKDIYDFTKKMGIEKFNYFGKCHGTIPGWYLVKEHPEVLMSFASFFLAPHLEPQNNNKWFSGMNNMAEMMRIAMRKPEGVAAKMEEVKSLGDSLVKDGDAIARYGGNPEVIWDSLEECEADISKTKVPVAFLFGTDDPLFEDHHDSNMRIFKVVPRIHYAQRRKASNGTRLP